MTLILHLGVTDVPYNPSPITPERAARRRPRGGVRWRPPRRASSTSTGAVAEILEHRYSLFSMFATFHGKDVEDLVAEYVQGKLENALTGAPYEATRLDDPIQSLEQVFRKALDDREFDGRIAGVPTQAARRGVNHRLAHPYARGNPERPSFIDTGQLQTSLRIWLES